MYNTISEIPKMMYLKWFIVYFIMFTISDILFYDYVFELGKILFNLIWALLWAIIVNMIFDGIHLGENPKTDKPLNMVPKPVLDPLGKYDFD